ncbi:CDP-archaeol synthase [Propylenella binzhouense]|uniref:CDP-archaeol synthase n=1 Tax=Propylenella binzhouense TaxID=2555902 RepID=A0A964WT08_9HYPH|nr:CDP-archaeol synthase [Propylenella binzhouense]MYZ47524.1 CDP-archaeol synthase [Propylenella binzhouense]
MTEEFLPLVRALVLVAVANSVPMFVGRLFRDRLAAPLDFGLAFFDGRPLLGASKTIRGLAVALLSTALAASLLGLGWTVGAGIGAAAMAGDVAASFTKRRLGLRPHAQAFGLDQVPEALLPLLLYRGALGLEPSGILAVTAAFTVLEVVLSRILYRLRLRDTPY